ncbi:hypothetical protein EV426DRAFT_708778 [Tirmania nivea]|nr:hypothetical protein EV426DRAFT_708778 [Tirmania nivea]
MHSVERVCFQIEEAQWYYEDFVRGHNPSLPSLGLRNFASKIFQHCPSLHEWKDSHEQAMDQFIAYKSTVPVRGAILLNHDLDQCVLVRGMKSSASWSFPRGKINQDEMDDVCAVREVLEETGYDASELINLEWYIEQSIRNQNIRLYIVPGVSLDTQFAPRTRNEIGTIQWHNLSDLPTFSKKKTNGEAPKMGKFYMVAPFLPQLRKWIQTDGAQWKHEQGAQAVEDTSPTDDEQNEQNGVVLGDASSNNEPAIYQDSSASLRSLLGIHAESAVDPVASQADAAAKLKSLLSIGPATESTQPSSISANGQILLSLLQSGSTPKKAEPQSLANHTMMQASVTPTRANVAPAVASPHSTVSYQSGVFRKPLTPLYDTPPAQSPAGYASPSHKASDASAAPPNFSPAPGPAKTTGRYAQAAPPASALLTSLQSQTKPVAMTEQATTLLRTLTSATPPKGQPQPQAASVSSPLDILFSQKSKPVPDIQQKLSLLSILKGESQPAPATSLVQQVQQENSAPVTPMTPMTPVAQNQASAHQPPLPPPPRHQTPPAAKREKQQHRTTPASPRGPRTQKAAKNSDFPKPTPAARPLPVAPTKEAPPVLQVTPKRITPPLEPYMNSPVNRAAGISLNGISPVLARATTDPMFDRRETVNQEQQQTLLALFKKPSVSTLKQEVKATPVAASVSSPMTESSVSATARLQAAVRKVQSQQVPSMKTGGGVSLGQDGGERAATSPRSPLVPGGAEAFAKDAFLMSYLEGVAKGAGK